MIEDLIDQLWCENVADSLWNNFTSGELRRVLQWIWSLGFLGNIINIFVFSHKHNAISPISNRLFLWLSITDLCAIIAVALHSYSCEWCTIEDTFLPEAFIFWTIRPYSDEPTMLLRVCYFLLQLFHTVGVGLNIALAMAYPCHEPINICDCCPVGSTVLSLYILGYILGLPILVISSKRKGPGMGETRFVNMIEYSYTAYNMVVRVMPFVILMFLQMTLLFVVFYLKCQPSRRQEAAAGASIRDMYSYQNTLLILVILEIYLITDLPSIVWFFTPDYYSQCFRMIRHLQQLFFLLNCGYHIFCYLLFFPQYRATVKLMVIETFNSRICGVAPLAEEIELP